MDYITFLDKAKSYPLFKVADVFKWFPQASKGGVLNQLHLWTEKGYLARIQKGIYKLRDYEIKDSFVLAGFLYNPSYVSIESALNSYGIIPDVPFAVTSICIAKTQTFRSKNHGVFLYHHVKPELFFGFQTVIAEKNYSYNIATPEKALFDFLYLKAGKTEGPKGFLEEMRITLPASFDYKKVSQWSRLVSSRKKSFHALIDTFFKTYAK